jgi:hypothetical protein
MFVPPKCCRWWWLSWWQVLHVAASVYVEPGQTLPTGPKHSTSPDCEKRTLCVSEVPAGANETAARRSRSCWNKPREGEGGGKSACEPPCQPTPSQRLGPIARRELGAHNKGRRLPSARISAINRIIMGTCSEAFNESCRLSRPYGEAQRISADTQRGSLSPTTANRIEMSRCTKTNLGILVFLRP